VARYSLQTTHPSKSSSNFEILLFTLETKYLKLNSAVFVVALDFHRLLANQELKFEKSKRPPTDGPDRRSLTSSMTAEALKNRVSDFSQLMGFTPTEPTVSVSQLWVYPLKSARGIRVESSKLGPFGFEYDRIYMLVEGKSSNDDPSKTQWHAMTLRTWPKVYLQILVKSDVVF